MDELRARLKGPVYGPAKERIPAPFVPLCGGAVIEVLGQRFEVIDVPGHTHAVSLAYPELSEEPVLSEHIHEIVRDYGGAPAIWDDVLAAARKEALR